MSSLTSVELCRLFSHVSAIELNSLSAWSKRPPCNLKISFESCRGQSKYLLEHFLLAAFGQNVLNDCTSPCVLLTSQDVTRDTVLALLLLVQISRSSTERPTKNSDGRFLYLKVLVILQAIVERRVLSPLQT